MKAGQEIPWTTGDGLSPMPWCSCWLASANPCAAPTGEPTKPVGAVLAGEKKKGSPISQQ